MSEDEVPDGPAVVVIGMGDAQGRGGLYNMLWDGGFERGSALLPILGFNHFSDVGRFRDVWIERDDTGRLFIHLYTRNGGGNRDNYLDEIAILQAHKWYERDADDSYDNTYASFWFRLPSELAELVEEHADEMVVDAIDTGARWKAWAEATKG